MRFQSARQVIHDAYMHDVTAIDISALLNEFGVVFTAKGADGKIMDHCERGIIQRALDVQKSKDKLAYSWNLFAYTPPGTGHGFERSAILNWLLKEVNEADAWRKSEIQGLARIAMHHIAKQDVTGRRTTERYKAMAQAIYVTEDEYVGKWKKYYGFFRGLLLELPERSLPPIANIVWTLIDKENEVQGAHEDLLKLLELEEA